MQRKWMIFLSFFSLAVVAATPQVNNNIITLYAEPSISSKHLATIAANKAVIPIFEQKDWVKIANPENGDTGWTLKSYLTGHPLVWHYIKQEKKSDGSQSYQAVGYQFSESNTPITQTEQKQIAAEAKRISKDFDQHIQTMQTVFDKNMDAFDKERQQMQAEFNKAFDEMQQSFDKPLAASPPPKEKSWWEKFKEQWK